MKRFILFTLSLLTLLPTARAWENPGFEWEVGADLTSAYLYRGMNYGGTTLQPEVSLGYGGLALTAWANIGAEDNSFQTFAPELDLTLSYSIFGLTVGVTHQYYFDGSKFFDLTGEGSSQMEVSAEYDFSELFPKLPLFVGWYTMVAGDDINEATGKRAFSSYFEVSYTAELPLGFYIEPTVGMTPWASSYTGYEGGFAVNNIAARVGWEWEIGSHFSLDVYAVGMLNTYKINSENAILPVNERYDNQRLNGAIGVGLWIF